MEKFPNKGPIIVIGNHTGAMEVVLMGTYSPRALWKCPGDVENENPQYLNYRYGYEDGQAFYHSFRHLRDLMGWAMEKNYLVEAEVRYEYTNPQTGEHRILHAPEAVEQWWQARFSWKRKRQFVSIPPTAMANNSSKTLQPFPPNPGYQYRQAFVDGYLRE